jgi:hypothetical protein
MIVPTPGRIVWYYPSSEDEKFFPCNRPEPLPGIVCHVWSEREVNLCVFDMNGYAHSMKQVKLIQPEDPPFVGVGSFCMWMPFQIGQARKASSEDDGK